MRSSNKTTQLVKLTPQRRELIRDLLGVDHKTVIEEGLFEFMNELSVLAALLVIESEVEELAGRRYQRDESKEFSRYGTQKGKIIVQGQKVPIDKQRVRTKNKKAEIALQTYKALNENDVLNKEMAQKLIMGLSTRNYGKITNKLLESTTRSRQSISRRAKVTMEKKLEEFRNRSIEKLNIEVILIDGIHLKDRVHVVALGIDKYGKKHILGMEQGSTEKSGICKSLIANMFERGLNENKKYLFVVDGSKALKKAIVEVFGKQAEIQRCIQHKKENILDRLPQKHHKWFQQKFNSAYNKRTYKGASKAFQKLRTKLSLISQSATNSFTEGLEDLLTLHRLGIDGVLRKSLCTTNSIESIFSSARYYLRNVKRWRKEFQMERWMATGLLEAESNLKRVRGYTKMSQLSNALTN